MVIRYSHFYSDFYIENWSQAKSTRSKADSRFSGANGNNGRFLKIQFLDETHDFGIANVEEEIKQSISRIKLKYKEAKKNTEGNLFGSDLLF